MFTREGITSLVQMEVKKLLEANNFVEDPENGPGNFVRKYRWGKDHSFLPRIHFMPEHISFGLCIDRRYDFIETTWQEWCSLVNVNVADPNNLTTLYVTEKNAFPEIIKEKYYDGYGEFKFEISEDGLSKIPEILEFVFNKKILPKLTSFNDIGEVDTIVNSQLDPPQEINKIFFVDGSFMFKRLAIAKYAGNPIFNQICDLYKSRFSKIPEIAKTPGKEYFLNYPIIFDKFLERCKNIEPLQNTILSTE